ncbi:MAG: IgGFc-binding protein [Nannocystaceae bacterium]|nr:IgGFc-binding protein [Nannocystaceae bacterium]
MALVPSSAGCEFIANRQLHPYEDTPDAVIVANPDETAVATVEFYQIEDGTNVEVLIEMVSLAPNEDFTLLMDNDFVPGTSSFLRSGGMFRIRSDFPVIAYQHSPYKNHTANDSSMLLPDVVLGREYVVTTYNPHPAQQEGLGLPTYFEVISLKKGTWVEWTPPVPTFGTGTPIEEALAGQTVRHKDLNRYDTLRIAASNEYEKEFPGVTRDLSGTVIRSSDPVWVVGGSRCSRIPVRAEPLGGFCDPVQEVLIPTQHWGTEYVAMHPPIRERENHYWRVYAGNDTVRFTTDPQVLTEDNCADPAVFSDGWCTLPTLGSWVEIVVSNGVNFVVTGETPQNDHLMVVGYLQSRQHPGEPDETATKIGDPAMYQMIPTEQWLGRYVFRTAEGYDAPNDPKTGRPDLGAPEGNFVQIVHKIGDERVFLDQEGVAQSAWEVVGDYEFATIPILTGSHTIKSADPVGVEVFGYSSGDNQDFENCLHSSGKCASSYAYPGGMQSLVINVK